MKKVFSFNVHRYVSFDIILWKRCCTIFFLHHLKSTRLASSSLVWGYDWEGDGRKPAATKKTRLQTPRWRGQGNIIWERRIYVSNRMISCSRYNVHSKEVSGMGLLDSLTLNALTSTIHYLGNRVIQAISIYLSLTIYLDKQKRE